DTLTFLAAGGRVSKTGEFFAGILGLKPIISPMPDGVRKLGLVRNRGGQLAFLKARLASSGPPEDKLATPLILLQYTDNQDWLTATLPDVVRSFYPQAEIHIVPLSLTTGAHLGPGSWSVAIGYPPAE
ncbi:MAG TPA: B12-binding domain-containing radical SAM protein, partial [Desulfobulbaceae bacterium]|nr:B12-binding domain-containing radical SAM protein [Desulfobulbaceae bacterium]